MYTLVNATIILKFSKPLKFGVSYVDGAMTTRNKKFFDRTSFPALFQICMGLEIVS